MALLGMVTEDGHSEVEVPRRIQAGVVLGRNISKKLKGKVLRACVTPACLYGLETVALNQHACMVWRQWR